MLIVCSPNIISHAILLTIEEVLKTFSLHNIYILISEESVSYKEEWGPSEEIQNREKGRTCGILETAMKTLIKLGSLTVPNHLKLNSALGDF